MNVKNAKATWKDCDSIFSRYSRIYVNSPEYPVMNAEDGKKWPI